MSETFETEAETSLHGQVARLDRGVLSPIELVAVDPTVLTERDPGRLGLAHMGDYDFSQPWPEAQLMIDVSRRQELHFYLPSAFGGVGQRIGQAVFEDPHPAHWWYRVRDRGSVAVFLGPVDAILRGESAVDQLRTHVWFGVAPVVDPSTNAADDWQ